MVRNRSGGPLECEERSGGPSGVCDRSGDPFRDLGRVEGYFGRCETGAEIIRKVWDGSRDPPGGPGWVVGPSRWFGTDREVLWNVRNGREVLPGSVTGRGTLSGIWDGWRGTLEGVRRVLRSSGRSGTGRETLLEVRDGSGDPPGCSWTGRGTIKEVQDWSRDPPKGLGRVRRSFGRSKIGREVLQKVGDRLGDPP